MNKKKVNKSKTALHLGPDEQELSADRFAQILMERQMERYGRSPTAAEIGATIEADMVANLKELTDPPTTTHKRVTLFESKGARPINIEAEVSEAGGRVISSKEVINKRHDATTNRYLRLSAFNKDLLLLALLEKSYSGNKELISELREFLKAKGLFWSYSVHYDMDLK